MSSTHILKGTVDKLDFNHKGQITLYNTGIEEDHPALLFISQDGEPPRVMTLEEHQEKVKAMLRDIYIHERDMVMSTWAGKAVPTHTILEIASKHGITL